MGASHLITDKHVAERVNELALTIGKALDHSIIEFQPKLSQEEFRNYKVAVGKVMGELFFEMMQPIYNQHPELIPDELNKD